MSHRDISKTLYKTKRDASNYGLERYLESRWLQKPSFIRWGSKSHRNFTSWGIRWKNKNTRVKCQRSSSSRNSSSTSSSSCSSSSSSNSSSSCSNNSSSSSSTAASAAVLVVNTTTTTTIFPVERDKDISSSIKGMEFLGRVGC
jgi:hypothetical protein